MREQTRPLTTRICLALIIAAMAFSTGMLNTDESFAKAKKPPRVKAIQMTDATSTSLTIEWAKTKKTKKYQVAYKKAGAKKFKYKTVKRATKKKQVKKITGLKTDTTYIVKVRAVAKNKKKGKWSPAKRLKTQVDYTKAKNETSIKVSAWEEEITIDIEPQGMTGTGTLCSAAANTYMKGDSMKGLVSKTVSGHKIGTFNLKKGKTFTIPRYADNGYDRLYDKYYILKKGKIMKGPIYATHVESRRDTVRFESASKKGLVDELDELSFTLSEDLGSNWTAMNIDFTDLILTNETKAGKPVDNSRRNADTIEVNGKTIYINQAYVSELDTRLSRYEKMGINVVAVVVSFVSTEPTSRYPRALKYIDDSRWTNGFNTSNELGRDYFIAGMEYLANRYSKGGKGRICDYVIGNEVDYAYDWYEIMPNESADGKPLPPRGEKGLRTGEIETKAPFDTFMEEYARTLRLANLAVKKYSSDIQVGVSLSKEWAQSRGEQYGYTPTGNKRYDSYRPKEFLDWMNYYTKKSGDFNWSITQHNYPLVPLGNAAGYETGLTDEHGKAGGTPQITGDPDTTKRMTQNNLELLQLYLDRQENLLAGQPRDIYLTENGCSSGTDVGTPSQELQRQQAAAIAQHYYRAASLPSVKAIIYYKIADRAEEGSTSYKLGLLDTTGAKKLSYEVWKYIDTSDSFAVSKKYLPYIPFMKGGQEQSTEKGNVTSWKDVMKMVDSKFDWDSHWNEDALTPIKLEEDVSTVHDLRTDKNEYGADDPIMVTAIGSSSDQVGLYKAGETAEADPIYSYKVGGKTSGSKHRSGVAYDIRAYGLNTVRMADAALPEGKYTVILSSRSGEELKKVDISISGTSSFIGTKKVITNKTEYEKGEDILVTASGEGQDWVGIYKAGDTPGGPTSCFWYYPCDNENSDAPHGLPGKPFVIQNGKMEQGPSTLPAGDYVVYLLENYGYNQIAKTETITITGSGSGEVDDLTSISYKLDNDTDGFANGTVTITKKQDNDAPDCVMYWADAEGNPLEGYSSLAKFHLTGDVTERAMVENTIIPPGAKKLIAYASSGGTRCENPVSVDLPEGADYTLRTDEPQTVFPVMSDLHVVTKGSGNDFNENTNDHYTKALQDVMANLPGSSGIFVNGDLADHGKANEFKEILNMHKSVEGAPDIHMSIGNHDWRTGNTDALFQKWANLYNPAVEPENVYYDEWVDGYHYIYLGSEAEGTWAQLSPEQLEWFENLLAEDSEQDQTKPIFVFLHEGMFDSCAGNFAGQWGYTNGVNQDSQLRKILKKYGQVVMFAGHTHYDLNTDYNVTYGSDELPVYVNTAAVGYLWSAYNSPAGEYLYGAQGYFVKVYDDQIYMFGRDFMTGKFKPNALYVIEPIKLDVARSKISLAVGDAAVNVGATTEGGSQLTYTSSNSKVARVDYNGNVRAVGPGKAKIYISADPIPTKAVNRKVVSVTVK